MGKSFVDKVTVSTVKALRPGDELRDKDLRGFGVRRQAQVLSYFVQAKINGRLKRLTIGRHGSPWTPETARTRAAVLLLAIKSGQDPAGERDAKRLRGEPFVAVAERFLELHGAKLKVSTCDVYRTLLRNQLQPQFGSRTIAEITAADVERAHVAWGARTPRTANHALSVLSKLMSWAEEHGYREEGSNPCRKIKHFVRVDRERYLSEAEMDKLGQVLGAAEAEGVNPFVIAAIRLLLLTGARRSEILSLRWEYVDFERQRLRLPDSKTGPKTIVLNAPAVAILKALPRLQNNPHVLPGHIHGTHLVAIDKAWYLLRDKAGLSDVRLHDLRHSFASVAVDAGGSLPLIGKLLGHGLAQTTARYAHIGINPAQALADTAGARINAALERSTVRRQAYPLALRRRRPLRKAAGRLKEPA